MITVILTVFKRFCYLEGAIRSVLQQTLADIELIVTDDANTKESRLICARFSGDERLRYRGNIKTLGAPLNIAAALREARGRYVCIINDDDLVLPEMLSSLVAPLENDSNCVLSFGNYEVINSHGNVDDGLTKQYLQERLRENLPCGPVTDAFEFTLNAGVMIVFGCLFRRAAFHPEWLTADVGGSYDWWMTLCLARGGGTFYYFPQIVMQYRVHQDSETARLTSESMVWNVNIFQKIYIQPLQPHYAAKARALLVVYLNRFSTKMLLENRNMDCARKSIARSLKLQWSKRWALVFLATFLYGLRRQYVLQHLLQNPR